MQLFLPTGPIAQKLERWVARRLQPEFWINHLKTKALASPVIAVYKLALMRIRARGRISIV